MAAPCAAVTQNGVRRNAGEILARAESTSEDPWLIASEIATARLAGKEPEYVKAARRIIESRSVSDSDKTELASSLGTLEAQAGELRRARKLFRTSLLQPNDNAVAQARWASDRRIIDDMNPALFQLPTADEARAWHSFYAGDWERARRASKNWYRDQPFAASPAVQASYVAAVSLENYAEAVSILHAALVANPTHPSLLNNLSYSLANLGNLEEAEQQLLRAKKSAPLSGLPIVSATDGLIAFRRQLYDKGSALYEEAIRQALSSSNRNLAAKASLFYVLEMLRANRPLAVSVAENAVMISTEWKDADFEMMRGRVLLAIERYQSARQAG